MPGIFDGQGSCYLLLKEYDKAITVSFYIIN